MLSALNLTYPQYLVLLALWEQPTMTVGALGKTLSLESNTLTPLLKRMETAGLVQRERSREDERNVTVTLTKQGRALEKESHTLAECVTDAASGENTNAEALRDEIFALAERLRAAT